MTYVINPWFFYLFSIVDGLKNLFVCITIISGFILAIGVVLLIFEGGFWPPEETVKQTTKNLKILLLTFIISILLSILIPCKITLYQMMIVKNITYENIEKTKKEGIKLVDYIIEKTEEYDKKDGD